MTERVQVRGPAKGEAPRAVGQRAAVERTVRVGAVSRAWHGLTAARRRGRNRRRGPWCVACGRRVAYRGRRRDVEILGQWWHRTCLPREGGPVMSPQGRSCDRCGGWLAEAQVLAGVRLHDGCAAAERRERAERARAADVGRVTDYTDPSDDMTEVEDDGDI